ncbi:hypothetical protein BKG77_16680 [Mycobacteroides chelonae]|uniref:hypothetical protein n=1 Tax=Mycobacteroides chelonae TaxID=1774 RepID=UPI0008A87372|nr:hypothetical protein [Mycobacteroides chelonae]OHU25017.1 hypothetical protein BKG77_16680 [Mycobacteroides chelonae]
MTTHFHGGVPGKEPGDRLHTANELGLKFEYNMPWLQGNEARYNKDKVYVSNHLGTAIGYAARYKDRAGNPVPGWVYEVEPIGAVEPDPDCGDGLRPDLASYCDGAVIVRVVEREVWLSEREQNQVIWPHLYWDFDKQVHAEDGTLLPSPQMLESGVTQAYIDLLPKWIGLSEIDGHGRMTIDGEGLYPPDILSRFDHVELVDRSHVVKIADRRARPNALRCSCTGEFTDKYAAAMHKIDMDKLSLIAERHQPESMTPAQAMQAMITALADRSRSQWRWFIEHQS